MKKYFVIGIGYALFFYWACKKEDPPVIIEQPKEFVARSSDFENYRSWPIIAKTKDPHPSLGTSHLSTNPDAYRWIYVKDNATRGADGKFPIGTMIVKEYRKSNGDTINTFYVAMVKRGRSFNPDFGDWEWFHLDPITLKIRLATGGLNAEYRGATLFNNTCNNCHNATKDKDFVFSVK
jgi:hypothetical protein